MHILSTSIWFCGIIIIQQNNGVIIINTQLTFENLYTYSCKNTNENVIEFSTQKAKNNALKSNFTSQGKSKAQSADSVKTLEEIEKIKKYFLDRKEYRNYCLFIVGITTGYRIGDLLQLKFSDFFNQDYSYKDEINIFEQKTKKRRKMPITENIKNALDLYTRPIEDFILIDMFLKVKRGKIVRLIVLPQEKSLMIWQ